MEFERVRREAFIAPEMKRYMEQLKESGFYPRTIYDIGSAVMHFADAASEIWPEATIVMFEAMDEVLPYYRESRYQYNVGVLTDADGRRVTYHQSYVHPGGSSYYREVGNAVSHVFFREADGIAKTGKTLATVVRERGFPLPDLIKIDVQGAEMDIIKGGEDVVRHAKHLLVEMQHTEYNLGAPQVTETKPYIESLGFACTADPLARTPVDADYAFVNTR